MAKAVCEPITARDHYLGTLCARWHCQNLAAEVRGADDQLSDRRVELLDMTAREIAQTKAQTPAGLSAKLAIYEHYLFTVIDAENPDCIEQLALSLLGDVRRLLCRV